MLSSLEGKFPPAILALADGSYFLGQSIGATGTTTMLIEGSENGGTSYSTLATISIPAASPGIKTSIKAYPLVRVRNSVAGTAGTANVYLEAV